MKEKCYLNKENYDKTKCLCKDVVKNIEIKDNVSTVYNYHISAIFDNINEIHVSDESKVAV